MFCSAKDRAFFRHYIVTLLHQSEENHYELFTKIDTEDNILVS